VESQADASEHILKELHRIMQEVRTEVTAVKAEVQQVLAEVTVEVQQVRAEVTTELQQVRAEVTACYDTGLFRPRPTLATPEVQIRTSSRRTGESVLFIGTQFSILYTFMYSPA
jgi:maltooligosyltrehalose synthase